LVLGMAIIMGDAAGNYDPAKLEELISALLLLEAEEIVFFVYVIFSLCIMLVLLAISFVPGLL